MSSLHKRSVHRSLDGCCICKAKSSSSRFTASKKYEPFFRSCFHVKDRRCGEICNACVLLVKRFKKLPLGSPQHWAHVVDARAGPGVKNFVRERRRESCRERSLAYKRKHVFGRKKMKSQDIMKISQVSSVEESHTDLEMAEPEVSGFIDLSFWKRKNICCGTIFVSPFGEAMVDPRFLSPCQNQSKQNISEKFAKSLLSFENIVEKELKNMKTMKKKSTEDRCFSYSDQDEGFFDRSSSSPPYCDRGKRNIIN